MSLPVSHQIISRIKELQDKVRVLHDFLNVGGLAGVRISEMVPVPSNLLLAGDLFEIARLGTPNKTYSTTIDDISDYVIVIADGRYLKIVNNLSDVENRTTSVGNLGFARGLVNLVFSVNISLTNTLPQYILLSPSADGLIVTLPPVNEVNSLDVGEGPLITNSNFTVTINDSSGSFVTSLNPGDAYRIILVDNSTTHGTYQIIPNVLGVLDPSRITNKIIPGLFGLSNNLRMNKINPADSYSSDVTNLLDFNVPIQELPTGTTNLSFSLLEFKLTDGGGATTTLFIPAESSPPPPNYTYFQLMRTETNPVNQFFLTCDSSVTLYSIDNPSGTPGGSFELTNTYEIIQVSRLDANKWLIETSKVDLQEAYDFSDGTIILDDTKPLEIKNSAGSSVNFNTTGNNAFEINTTTQGSLGWPLLTTVQRDAIPSPTVGLHGYDLTLNAPVYYDGTQWLANQHIDLPLSPEEGGTGVANDPGDTITLGGPILTANSFTTAGDFPLTLTTTALTDATIPSGTVTLIALPGSTSITTLGTITTGTWQADIIQPQWGGTGIANGSGDTITLGGAINTGGVITTAADFITSGANSLTLTTTGVTNATIPAGTVTLVALPGSTSLTTLGTVTTGMWNASIISPIYGGTGVNNGSNTITLGGNINTANSFTTAGNFPLTLTTTGTTNATIPVGTVTLLAAPGSTAITTLGTITTGTWQADVIQPQWGGTGVANASSETITLGGPVNIGGTFTVSGISSLTLTTTGNTNATIPSGTVTLLAAPGSSSITTVGTITSGTWQADVIQPQWGGTGISNGSGDTITLGGPINTANSFTTAGNNSLTLTTTGTTNATIPSGTVTLVALPGSTSITTLGTISTGTWQGTIIDPIHGGTGILNTSTITLGGPIHTQSSLTQSGPGSLTLTTGGGPTNATFPSGTVTLLAAPGSSSITTVGTITTGTWNGSVIGPQWGGTGVSNASSETITLGGPVNIGGTFTVSGGSSLTLTTTATTNATIPSGTVTLLAAPGSSSITTVGTITSGTWNGGILNPSYGGTGMNNSPYTIDLGGSVVTGGAINTGGGFVTHGNFQINGTSNLVFEVSGNTDATFPSGTYTIATVPGPFVPTSELHTITDSSYNICTNSTGTTTFSLSNSIAIGSIIRIVSKQDNIAAWKINALTGTIYTDQGIVTNYINSNSPFQAITIFCDDIDSFQVMSYTGTIVLS
jgi:hypothetical protein